MKNKELLKLSCQSCQMRAREIMGKNFLGTKETISRLYSSLMEDEEILEGLAKIPFKEKTLELYKKSHILVAVYPGTFNDILHKIIPFDSKSAFIGQTGLNKAGWYLVRKTPVSGSFQKTWDEQLNLLHNDEEVPIRYIVAFTIICYYLTHGEKLFHKVYARCSDRTERGLSEEKLRGSHGVIGDFDDCVMLWGNRRYPWIGNFLIKDEDWETDLGLASMIRRV